MKRQREKQCNLPAIIRWLLLPVSDCVVELNAEYSFKSEEAKHRQRGTSWQCDYP